jgi:peptidoglycan/LPS O-acetylase OafA/YrhL
MTMVTEVSPVALTAPPESIAVARPAREAHAGTSERQEIAALTGLRFCAALFVCFSHLPVPPTTGPGWIRAFLFAGFNGVTIFFVLSGFVICYSYYDRIVSGSFRDLRDFFVARFARIYPMYFLTFLWYFAHRNITTQVRSGARVIVENLTMVQAWNTNLTKAYSYNTVAWSVSVEIFLYVCFPLIVYLLLRYLREIWQLIAVGAVTAAVVLGAAATFTIQGRTAFLGDTHYWLYQLPSSRLGDFILGCVVARIFMLRANTPITERERRVGTVVLAISAAEIILLMCVNRPFLVPFRWDAGYAPFVAALVYCLARYRTFLSRLLSAKLIVLLGAASYSFYLLHAYFLYTMFVYPKTVGTKTQYFHDVLMICFIALISLGAYTYIENPARKYIRRALSKKRRIVEHVPQAAIEPA